MNGTAGNADGAINMEYGAAEGEARDDTAFCPDMIGSIGGAPGSLGACGAAEGG